MNGFRPQYVRAAIQNETDRVATAPPSRRNDTLNRAAFNLASLGVSGREIIHSLRPAALLCGLKNSEIYSTINSGIRAGKQHPRFAPASSNQRSIVSVQSRLEASGHYTVYSPPNCDAREKFKVSPTCLPAC